MRGCLSCEWKCALPFPAISPPRPRWKTICSRSGNFAGSEGMESLSVHSVSGLPAQNEHKISIHPPETLTGSISDLMARLLKQVPFYPSFRLFCNFGEGKKDSRDKNEHVSVLFSNRMLFTHWQICYTLQRTQYEYLRIDFHESLSVRVRATVVFTSGVSSHPAKVGWLLRSFFSAFHTQLFSPLPSQRFCPTESD